MDISRMKKTNNRQKGKRGERYFASRLREVFPNIRRNAGTQSQSGGVDLENTSRFDFEVKTGKSWKIKKVRQALDQVNQEGKKLNYKIVLVKPDREDPYAIMPFCDLKDILVELMGNDLYE